MKRNPPQKQLWMLSLVIALMALLPLLAWLQYRWLGQVSEGERELKKNTLTSMARQFCQEFDSQLTAIHLFFQPTPIPLDGKINQAQDDFDARYRRWRETSPHPKLVKEIYQTQPGESEGRLTRFNSEKGAFEHCEWPDGMSKLRKSLEEHHASRESMRLMLRESTERKTNNRGEVATQRTVVHLNLPMVDEDLPGVIIAFNDKTEEGTIPILSRQSFRIIALDADYIRRELIPGLARRHFGDSVGEYRLAVTKHGQTDRVVYRSDGGVSETDLAGGDVTIEFFKIRLEEANKLFFAQLPRIHGMVEPGMAVKLKPQLKQKQIAISVASEVKFKRDGDVSAPPSLPAPPGAEEITRSLLTRNDAGVWRLVVKHRAGSLEAAVTNARHRNLAVSFGILLLLGASVGFIVLSSRRAQRLATQQMEFVAGVSHELRTPLAVICSAAENLADGVIDHRDQIKRYGGLIRDEGRRLTGMVEQVLEFAGAQSGRKSYELRPTELSRVIEDAITACHLQLAEGGFEIERKIAANLPLVHADGAALVRAIQNLLCNAMKYSGGSRWIGLSVESATAANGEEVRIAVSDRGLGIAPSEMERIFEPFYRGKDVIAAQIHGNGLGLSLVKHIAAAHGGSVSVESKPGQGSRFILRLPIPAVAESSAMNKDRSDYEARSQFKTGHSHSGD
ncbi:MAG TPA: HAMP domain-containing sensor histidine kinase [Blastocatellia bacterium]|nr:HAMP domain-containing sensor histidine kinase [Blastocatellia bacterium]